MYPMENPVPSFTLLADGIRKSCGAVACDRDPGLPAGLQIMNVCSLLSCDAASVLSSFVHKSCTFMDLR